MKRVLYALVPVVIASVHFFGWRSLLTLLVVNIAGFATEYAFTRVYKEPVTSAVFVTNFLFTLSLPPTLPLWMAVIGIVFGVTFGEMVFGGFGRNIFNPALVGRAFVYVSFPVHMNSVWAEPFGGVLGGIVRFAPDAITQATPLRLMKDGTEVLWSQLFIGNTSGSLGETSALLVILCGIYIVWKKAANYRIVVSGLVGMLLVQFIFWLSGVRGAIDPLSAMLSGSFLFGLFFYATEPISASQINAGRWIYGAFIGVLTVIIRVFSGWAEGMMFAVLLANMFAPIMDYGLRSLKSKRVTAGA